MPRNNLFLNTTPSDSVKAVNYFATSTCVMAETIIKYLTFARVVFHWYFYHVQFPPMPKPDRRFNQGSKDLTVFKTKVDNYVERIEKTLRFIVRDMALRDLVHSASTIPRVPRELI